MKGPDNTVYDRAYTLYQDAVNSAWRLWDCCAFLPQVEAEDDAEHGSVVEFTIGEGSDGGTVVGFFGRDTGGVADVDDYINEGVLRFDMKVVTMPDNGETSWLLKLESAGGNTAAEVELTTSKQGETPVLGEWQAYTFPLIELASAGLDLTAIDIVMIFPSWGNGTGAVYRIDNIYFGIPSDDDISNDISEQKGNGEELILNGMFDSSANWGGTDGMVDSISNGIFTADVAVAGNPWDVSLKQNMTLIADRTYVLKFDARSDDARDIIAGLGLDHDPWTNVVETVTLTNEWTTYMVTITTVGFGDDNSRVLFDLGAAVGEVQLDNVSVQLVGEGSGNGGGTVVTTPGEEIVANGGFDSAASWGGTDGMAASISNGIFSANIAAAGNPWDVSLKQNMTLVPDTTYTLTFDARSADSREIMAGLGLDHDPWTNVVETLTLTPDWTTYTLTITTTGFGDDASRVFFDLGAATGEVQLDNISVKIVDDGSGTGSGGGAGGTAGGELLINGGFDSATGWGGTDGMAASVGGGIFSADIAAAGNPWDVSLKQSMTLVLRYDVFIEI
ncbi:carbohydrate binding domain-containing protein [Psychrosphaera algicola]|uniref:Carbohydrate binding domain-containing protein n=1 Tax=Psychrosphaera algicola TaxID=3023714 RepID=A0ABT5FDH0_9GAMM|nr:carbohydrate binding domain-containing protein [Psychrosphaera sp. G1-22]MDC2888652.1 carbohydrate binding domain-containing protein [Psychrosphaera sp. G1-22]